MRLLSWAFCRQTAERSALCSSIFLRQCVTQLSVQPFVQVYSWDSVSRSWAFSLVFNYISETACHAAERSTLCSSIFLRQRVTQLSVQPCGITLSSSRLCLPDGTNMCDNCQNAHDTSSYNSCASAQHVMLPACVSTHNNFFFPLKTLFISVYTSCPFLCCYSLHYFSLEWNRLLSLSVSYCSFYLLLFAQFPDSLCTFFCHSCI
jgi:hypothetical protein